MTWLALFDRLFSLLDPMRGQVAAIWASIITPVAGGVNNRLGAIWVLLTSPGTGWGHVQTAVDTTATAVTTLAGGHTLTEVLAAIAALPAGSAIVVPSPSDNAAGVWAYVNGATPAPGTYQVGAQLAEAWGVLTELYRSGAWRVNGNPFFVVEWPGSPITNLSTSFAYPTPDWTAIGSYTSVVDWLNGTDTSGRTWSLDADSGLATTYDTLAGEQWFAMRCLLRDTDLYPTAGVGAPIWPGLAGVTLGTPVAITEPTIIAGPMDGILITLDTADPGAGQWAVDTFTSWRYAGYVVFLSAEGHADTTQFLGPADNVFCPKGMAHADSCVVYLNKISTATVTPWTLA